jgi:MFS family permease
LIAESALTLTLLRFGQGFGAAMILPIAQAYAGDISPLTKEGKYMGLFSFAVFCGFGVGPLMGGILKDLYGMDACIYALSALTFWAFIMVCLFLPESQFHRKGASVPPKGLESFLSMLTSKTARGLIIFRFTTAMCRGTIITFVPILAHNKLHLSSSEIGLVISSSILVTSALQMPFGILADKVNRKAVITVGGLLFSSFILVLPSITTFLQLLLLSLLSGVFGALVLPAATAVMVEEGRVYGMGSAMSLFNMSMSLGLACGPLLAGVLVDTVSLNFGFYFFGFIGILGLMSFALHCRGT